MISLLFVLIVSSCEKSNVVDNTPECLTDQIEALEKISICDDPSVEEYNFQDNLVYLISQGTCGADLGTTVLDSNCKNIGVLGGFIGNDMINGEDFSSAVFIRVIWKK